MATDCISTYNVDKLHLLVNNITKSIQRADITNDAMQNITSLLKSFGKDGVIQILKELLKNDGMLQSVASRSYLHGNGFYKIILEDNEQFKIRLHVWFPDRHAEENVHNHRWYLMSTIITGMLESEIWEDALSTHEKSYDEYIYLGTTDSTSAKNLYSGKSRIKFVQKVIHQAGDAYFLPPHTLHRIISSGNKMTSTLICHSKASKLWSRTIVLTSDFEPNIEHRHMSKEELKDIILKYLKLIDNEYLG